MTGAPMAERLVAEAAADGIEQFTVAAVVSRQGSVLVLRRAVDPFLGLCHTLPSGLVEPGETLGEALVRTVRAVSGLDVKAVGDFLGSFDYRSAHGVATRHFVFTVGVVAFEPIRLKWHLGYRWAARVADLDVTDSVRAILEERQIFAAVPLPRHPAQDPSPES